mmetsp:Transcript_19415/g.45174  ORF Transcript_19415/g.45174 Transcript_19415/m.45174 type:complete len:115 (+) Transcript_19415:464-808(+)
MIVLPAESATPRRRSVREYVLRSRRVNRNHRLRHRESIGGIEACAVCDVTASVARRCRPVEREHHHARQPYRQSGTLRCEPRYPPLSRTTNHDWKNGEPLFLRTLSDHNVKGRV